MHHADVRRLLMNMKSKTEASALVYVVGAAPTWPTTTPTRPERRARSQALST